MLTEEQKEMITSWRSKRLTHARIAARLGVDVELVAEFSNSIPRKKYEQVQPHRAIDPTPEEIQSLCAAKQAEGWKFGRRIKLLPIKDESQ